MRRIRRFGHRPFRRGLASCRSSMPAQAECLPCRHRQKGECQRCLPWHARASLPGTSAHASLPLLRPIGGLSKNTGGTLRSRVILLWFGQSMKFETTRRLPIFKEIKCVPYISLICVQNVAPQMYRVSRSNESLTNRESFVSNPNRMWEFLLSQRSAPISIMLPPP